MRFFEIVLSGAALVSAALAVEFNTWPQSVKAGESVTLTYSPKDAATTIILRKGASTDLDTLETLTTSSTGGSFTWAVPSNLENGDDYAFEIRQAGADPNYSGQFSLSGGLASAVSSSAYSTVKETSSASKTAPASTSAYSTIQTVTTTAASASGSIVPTHGSNSTISTGTPTASKSSSSSASASAAAPPVENSGAASSLGVNAAAIFGAMGALAYFA